jgi:hypothetical protein
MDYFAAPVATSYVEFARNHHCVIALNEIVRVNGRSDCVLIPTAVIDKNTVWKLLREKNSHLGS